MIIFLVQHLHTLADGTEDIKIIGVYNSETAALAAVDRVKSQPGFENSPEIIDRDSDDETTDGFYIDEYEVNKDHWLEGFVTV
jgi:hypothetical protein